MSQGNLDRVREIFLGARGLPPDLRAAFLKSACGDDAVLRNEVEELLANDIAPTVSVGTTEPLPRGMTSQIGPYTILGSLGEGGMGTVYKAEQRHPIRRTVAIKVIKLGFDSKEVIARFESERQALARMDHPNIAKVLDAGTDERGRPYFVMDYVPGSPVTKYADENRLTIQQRLELMLQVCDAIGHAHAKAIIHRDIKAGNVLAYTTPEGPRVKVIDFGVAKALTLDRLTDLTFNTGRGQAIGTYESMSPEQADGSPDIDTRSDVYSIGVLLYELLSGTKPFDKADLAKAADEEIKRIIREVDPPKPSTRLSGMTAAEGSTIATSRRAQIGALTKELRSELEWIPLMAMRKERDRRYASPLELAEDVRNYLADRPLRAGPESLAYRGGKAIRRNRSVFLATAGVLIMLVVGTAIYIRNIRVEQAKTREEQAKTGRALAEAQQQRAKADARFADVRQLANDFMFKFDDALVSVSGATAARKMLADTASRYLDRLNRDVAADKTLSRELATSYKKVGDIQGNPGGPNLGQTDQALASYDKSLKIFQQLARENPRDDVAARDLSVIYQNIGTIEKEKGQTDDALANLGKSLEIRKRLAHDDPSDPSRQADLSGSYQMIGNVDTERGQIDDALDNYVKALNIQQKLSRDDVSNIRVQRDLAISYVKIGDIQARKRQLDLAFASYSRSLDTYKKLASDDPGNAEAQRDLSIGFEKVGFIEAELGKTDAALSSYVTSLGIHNKLASADPRNVVAQQDLSFNYLRIGDLQLAKGQSDDAIASYGRSLEIQLKLAEEDPRNAVLQRAISIGYSRIGDIQAEKGQTDSALANYRESLEIFQKLALNDPSNPRTQLELSESYAQVGEMQAAAGKSDDAIASCGTSLKILQLLAQAHPRDARIQRETAVSYLQLGTVRAQVADATGLSVDKRLDELHSELSDYQAADNLLKKLKSDGKLAREDEDSLPKIEASVQKCNDQISLLEKRVVTQPANVPTKWPTTRPLR